MPSFATSRLSPGASVLITVSVLLVIVVVVQAGAARREYMRAEENIVWAVSPSAPRAFAYGERHFDATDPGEYDVNRAEYFFKLAAAEDPTLPYVYHELARIDFLRGYFRSALAKIDFQISMHGDNTPNSYYIRGLIEGYMGNYTASIADYRHFLQFDSTDWAAMNDYAWVLLKAHRAQEAVDVTKKGLALFPYNPWLLNTNATALYEIGDIKHAYLQAQLAVSMSNTLTESSWLHAYPGNDPQVAVQGIETFQKAAADNMHTIRLAFASSTVQ